MLVVFLILSFFFEIYSIILLAYIIHSLLNKKRLALLPLLLNFLCILFFFWIRTRVINHEIIIIGTYGAGQRDWGTGLNNVATTTMNLGVLCLLFIITQIIFWIFFKKQANRFSKKKVASRFLEEHFNTRD